MKREYHVEDCSMLPVQSTKLIKILGKQQYQPTWQYGLKVEN